MQIFSIFSHPEWSMRRKLFGYMLILAMLLLFSLMSVLLLFGRFESNSKTTYSTLDIQMEVFEKDVFTHYDRLAAASIQLSNETTASLEEYMTQHELSFDNINNSPTDITAVQKMLIEPLKQKLYLEKCSGVFIMLDTTINETLPNAEHSRCGLYLQQNGYKNTDESILLYRGLSDVGKQHGIMPHRKWRLEFHTDQFPDYETILQHASLPLEKAYFLTDCFTLPGTSEDAMLITAPILGSDGTFYGICGYEISENYFTAYHAQPTKLTHLTCLFSARSENSLNASSGFSCGVSGGYHRAPQGILTIKKAADGLFHFTGEKISYIGITKELSFGPNNAPYTLAVMTLKSDYDKKVTRTLLQNISLWSLLLFFTISCCLYFSRRYLSPILKALEQIKSDKRTTAQSKIPEINDLFVFLAEQDRKNEASLSSLEKEKEYLQTEYEQAKLVYEKAQHEYSRALEELADAKTDLDRLAYSRKNEIDPLDYQNFLKGMQTLTKKEKEIFEWYLEGKTAKEILELSGTKESTLKFHNHNILNKLGVSSRKHMLRYAALMKQEMQDL